MMLQSTCRHHRLLATLCCLALSTLLIPDRSAMAVLTGPITGVTVVSGSVNSEYLPDTRLGDDTTNGFGFDGTDFTFPGPTVSGLSAGSVTDPDSGYTIPHHTTAVTNMWLTNNVEPGSLTYDLGSVLLIDRMWIYNYNEGGSFPERGATTTGTVLTSLDGVSFSVYTSASNVALKMADGLADLGNDGLGVSGDIDSIDMGLVEARFVRFENLVNFSVPSNYVGLSEVIFFEGALPPVPEPSSFLLLGLGALGLVRHTRRRRRKA